MPKLKLKPFKIQKIPIKQDNIHLIQYSYKVKQGVKNASIKQAAEQVMASVQAKIADEKLDLEGKLMVTQLYDNTLFWQSGKFTDFGDDPNFYDFAMEYEYKGEKLQDKFQNFNLTVKLIKPSGGCPSESESKMNDCLWYCLRDMFGQGYMPKPIDTQRKLKKQTATGRTDPIHVGQLEALAVKIKTNINVVGDVERQYFDNDFKRTVTVKLHDGHYSLPSEHKMDPQLRSNTNYHNKPIILYAEVVHPGQKQVSIVGCDGASEFPLSWQTLTEYFMKPLSSKHIYRRVDLKDKSLLEHHKGEIEDTEEFLKHSKNFINLYRQGNIAKSAKYIFGKMSRTLIPPEPIQPVESAWIHEGRSGGLIFGQPVTLPNAICYDVNKMYPSILMSPAFSIPMKAGEFKNLSTELLRKGVLKGLSYGLYRCVVTNPDEVGTKLFKIKRSNVYTHWDLRTAAELGLTLTMSEQSPNVLLFKHREKGHNIFKQFVEYMVDINEKAGPRLKPKAKKMLNSLWGALCETSTTKVDMNKESTLDLSGRDIVHIEPHRDSVLIKLQKTENKYKTNYARMLPFMTSYGRRVMFTALKGVEEHVYRIHTDGFVTDRPLESLPLSTKIGEWKIEKQGRCQVHNAMKVEFY